MGNIDLFRCVRLKAEQMNPWAWLPIEQDILRTIAIRVRLITASQIARGWFAGQAVSERCTQQLIQRLETASLIARRITEAHPILELRRPLFAWRVGMPPLSDGRIQTIAALTRNRWNQDHEPVEVIFATKCATALFGAFVDARHFKNSEATHDLHLTEVYFRYRKKAPRMAADWKGEAAFPKMGFEIARMKDPDAFLVDRKGMATRIVEFAGSYEEDHLRAFHDHCAGGAASRLASSGWTDSKSHIARLYSPDGTSYELW